MWSSLLFKFFFSDLIEIHLLLQLFCELILQAEVGTDNRITQRPPAQTINSQHNGLPTTLNQQQSPTVYSARYNRPTPGNNNTKQLPATDATDSQHQQPTTNPETNKGKKCKK
jgi:hypothetical protein